MTKPPTNADIKAAVKIVEAVVGPDARGIIVRACNELLERRKRDNVAKRNRADGMATSKTMREYRKRQATISVAAVRRHVKAGLSNPQIAEKLGCSRRGVQALRLREGI